MNWGVVPILYQDELSDAGRISFAIEQGKIRNIVQAGDILIVTSGHSQTAGGTDLIRVLTVD